MSKPNRITELPLTTNPLISDLLPLARPGSNSRVTIGTVLNSNFPVNFGDTIIDGDYIQNGDKIITGSIDVSTGVKINGEEYSSSLYESSSISGSVIEFTQGDTTIQQVKLPPGLGYGGLGWARYDDTTYTTSSAYSVGSSTTVILPCNGSGSIETHMHSTVPFYNPSTQKIQAENDGDVYSVTIDFNMRAASNPSVDSYVRINLNNTTGTPYTRVGRDLFFQKNTTDWHSYHEIFQYYSDTDFVENGNVFNIVTNGIGVDIADVIIFIQRTQNHSQH